MTPAIKGILLAVSSSLAVSIVAKVTVITALALFAAWLARGSRAAVRHALLAAAFGVTLLLPIASILVPPVRLRVPAVVENRVPAAPPLASGVEQIPPVLMTDDPGDPVISVPQSSRISLSNLLLTGWIAGGAIFLLPLVIGLWQIRLLRRSGLPWRHGQSLAETIALDAGVQRRVEVLLHETVPGPMTCGIVHPTIVLPRDAESWNEEDLKRALLHELEHVRRGDSVSRCFARGACAVYWFHPLVWIAQRRLVLEAERACDDAVLRRSEAAAYADQLVGLAKRLSAAQRSPLLAMANRAELASRVRAVLDAQQRRGRAGTLSLGLTITAAVLVLSMSSLILVATPQAASAQTVTPPTFDTVQGEPSHEKPGPLRLVAEPQPPSVAPAVVNPPASQLLAQQIDPQQSSTRPAAQSTAASAPLTFEVASVRPAPPVPPTGGVYLGPARGGPGTPDPEQITWSYASMKAMLLTAFDVKNYQITGPAWLDTERYDIAVKVPAGATVEQVRVMWQNLLAQRFGLTVRHEPKEFQVQELVIAKGGSKLKETSWDAAAPLPPGPPQRKNGDLISPGMVHTIFPGPNAHAHTVAMAQPISQLTTMLSNALGLPVLDKTGLTGKYDFTLDYAINLSGLQLPAPPLGPGAAADTASDPEPDLAAAVQREIGLALVAGKANLDVVVIEQINKVPTEN